ncbi:MAG TPA: prepilin-type N-terminal cleavage/methylation domain-containing protein [Terriglobia bacterium]|nr:prepilin-type N-terminal cleavage/methylation domain-containing protein [Terriglobia bacterium]
MKEIVLEEMPVRKLMRTIRHSQLERACGDDGFTLLELATVMALILILVAIAAPAYHMAVQRAREAVLRSDLHSMRSVIDEFTVDKQRPPESLQEIVEAGYLHAIPVDPFTGSADTWQADIEQVPVPPDQTATGVVDVHSGSDGKALDGTDYNTW